MNLNTGGNLDSQLPGAPDLYLRQSLPYSGDVEDFCQSSINLCGIGGGDFHGHISGRPESLVQLDSRFNYGECDLTREIFPGTYDNNNGLLAR